jgi:outer membrane protein
MDEQTEHEMKKYNAYQQVLKQLLALLFGLPFFSFTVCEQPQEIVSSSDNVLILDLETTINLALNSDKLFDAYSNIEIAKLSREVSLSEFDLSIVPKADTGYIGGGTAGSGLTVGGGLNFDKKFPLGTQVTMTPSVLKAAKKFHSNFEVRVSQPILRGFGREYNSSGIKRAEFVYRTASRAFYKNMNSTVLRAIELLYEVAKQEEIVKLNRESHERLQKFWRATTIKERIGLADALDVYRAETELKQAEDSFNQAKESLQDTKDSLRDILPISQNTKFIVKVSFELSDEEWNLDEAIETALQNRIEIDQGLDQLEESRRLARLSKNDLLPDLNFVVDYSNLGYGEEFTGSFGSRRESRWGIGFTTSTDFNCVSENSSYENTLIGVETAEKLNLEIKKSIVLEVKKTLRAFNRAHEKIELQALQTKNSEGGLKLAKAKFLREFATNFDVIQAEKAFHSAQITLINALIEHKVGEYRLRAVVGLLVEKPRIDEHI